VRDIKVSASILCADFTRLGEQIKLCEDAGVDMIHVDVMDGHFVPNITIGPMIVHAIRPLTTLPIEAHLMIEHPGRLIDAFLEAGTDMISLHAECYGPRKAFCREFDQYPKEAESVDRDRVKVDIDRIKQKGKKVFMVLNPGTPVCLGGVLRDIDGVLIMSVNPGFARQKFMPSVLPKIQQLRAQFAGDIAVDGGINELTAPEAVKAGASILATASYFFNASKPKDVVKFLKGLSSV
jgi:ribulose-phosphate 3-epimerase